MVVECRDVYLCPRCRAEMDVYVETERMGDKRGGSRFLKCPACSLRIQLDSYSVRDSEDEVVVVFTRRPQSRQPVRARLCYQS